MEYGVQQIRRLDHFCDNLTTWLCGIRPEGRLTIDRAAYGVRLPVPLADVAATAWQSAPVHAPSRSRR